jgi:uncharacterized protein YciI
VVRPGAKTPAIHVSAIGLRLVIVVGQGVKTFLVIRSPGPRWVAGLGPRSQPLWDEHARFMDELFNGGLIVLGGPFADHSGAVLVCEAANAADVRAALLPDPWVVNDIQDIGEIREWTLYLDARVQLGT